MAGERAARRGPVAVRVAFVDLARRPGAPVAVGRLRRRRGRPRWLRPLLPGDAAAQRVRPGGGRGPARRHRLPRPELRHSADARPAGRWDALARGVAWPVRRTQATFVSGDASVTVPALGVPAAALARMHGWRASDGPAPLRTLAARSHPPGPARTPGPPVPARARSLSVRAGPSQIAATVTADLRDAGDTIHQVASARRHPRPGRCGRGLPRPERALGAGRARARRAGRPGGHQRPPERRERRRRDAGRRHRDAGGGVASSTPRARRSRASARRRGAASGPPRVARRPAAACRRGASPTRASPASCARRSPATRGRSRCSSIPPPRPPPARRRRLALTVDGEPVAARVAGVVRRFPTSRRARRASSSPMSRRSRRRWTPSCPARGAPTSCGSPRATSRRCAPRWPAGAGRPPGPVSPDDRARAARAPGGARRARHADRGRGAVGARWPSSACSRPCWDGARRAPGERPGGPGRQPTRRPRPVPPAGPSSPARWAWWPGRSSPSC